MKTLQSDQQGQILALSAIVLVFLFAIAGLAIEGGIAYGIKAKLNAAVDAATIAAGRAVKQGGSNTTRIINAQTAATNFFNANYPVGYFGATRSITSMAVVPNPNGSWDITVTATAQVSTMLGRLVGWQGFTVNAEAQTHVRDLDMVLVLDCSASLGDGISPPGTFNKLKSSAINFINQFQDGSGGDRVGLVTFASGAVVDVPINKNSDRGFNRAVMTTAINNLGASGYTASGEALRRAKVELDAVPADIRSSFRVIVFFSDGAPNNVAGDFSYLNNHNVPTTVRGDLFSETSSGSAKPSAISWVDQRNAAKGNYTPINTLPSTDYTGTVTLASHNNKRTFIPNSIPLENNRCNVNKAARNMAENVANMARSGTGTDAITIYTLGLGRRLQDLEITFCGYSIASEKGETILKRLANDKSADTYNTNQPAGLYFYAADASQLNSAFYAIASQILRIAK